MALSVDDLRTFTLVSCERSASRAAAHLGVTQQSVSERIRRLEHRLGVELFVRRPHGMVPTAAGYRLLPYAQRAIALMDEALSVLEDDSVVRVGVQASVAGVALPFVRATLGGFRLETATLPDADEVLDGVRAGAIDLGFGSFGALEQGPPIGLPAPGVVRAAAAGGDEARRIGGRPRPFETVPGPSASPEVGSVQVARAFDDRIVCVGPADHPLSHRRVALADLAAHGVVLAVGASPPAEGAAAGAVRLSARSAVAGQLADGVLVEIDVVDLPAWVVAVHVAYRAGEEERPPVAAVLASTGPPAPIPLPTTAEGESPPGEGGGGQVVHLGQECA